MKTYHLVFALICAVYCRPDEQFTDYLENEDLQNDENYEIYQEQEEVPEENNVPKVEQPVFISTKGETFTKTVNDTVVLPCAITGEDYVRVWRRHGTVLYQGKIGMGAKENMHLQDGNLEISNLQEKDDGEYECMAMISEINKPTITHTLVLRTPPHVESLTADGDITVLRSGDTLRLRCNAEGHPKPVISWHRGSERLPMTGERLTVDNVRHHDAGEYRCLADNNVGEPSFAMIQIKVEHKPVITIDQISVSSDDEQDTELKCTVHAEPKAQVDWRRDGVKIKNTPRTELSSSKNVHILVLKGLQGTDFGVYTCSAVNSIGNSEKNVTLVKTPAVVRFIKPANNTRDVILTWEVQSKSPIQVHELQYRKKGASDWHLIKPEVESPENEIYTVKYVLTGLEPGAYETRIRSQNGNGWAEFSDIMSFEGVYSKHGHHKSHKKGHKDHKDVKGTQEVTKPTPTVKSLDTEEPAEHQENVTFLEASYGAIDTSSASTARLSLACLGLALFVILPIRTSLQRL